MKPIASNKIFLTILAAVALLGLGNTANATSDTLLDDSLRAEIRTYAQSRITEGPLVGLAVGIVQDGVVLGLETFGYADLAAERQIETDTRFQIASLSKQFAAVSVMMLVEEGKVGLEDEIGSILPSLPQAWHGITVRQLLSHTSGILDYAEFENIREVYQVDTPRKKILEYFFANELEFTPGTQWKYSNSAYYLVGMIVESIAEQSYANFLQSRIFDPLGMTSTYLDPVQNADPKRAIGYDVNDGVFTPSTYNSPSWSFAAGGILSSVEDLALWNASLDKAELLSEESLGQMWSQHVLDSGDLAKYGLGWELNQASSGLQFVFHRGNKPGFSATMARVRNHDLSLIILSNRTEGESARIMDGIGKLLLQRVASQKK